MELWLWLVPFVTLGWNLFVLEWSADSSSIGVRDFYTCEIPRHANGSRKMVSGVPYSIV